jgi:hypothetical protein
LLDTAARAHNNLGLRLGNTGDVQGARDHYGRAAALARQIGRTSQELFYLGTLVVPMLFQADFAAVVALDARYRAVMARLNVAPQSALPLHMVQLQRYRGELGVAAQGLQDTVADRRAHGDLQTVTGVGLFLAEVWIELEQWEAATALLEEIIALEDRGIGLGPAARARCQRSIVAARQGQGAEAQAWLATAEARAGATPTVWDREQLALATGHLAARQGRWAEAGAAFAVAAEAEGEMGMRWYQAQTWRAAAVAHWTLNTRDDLLTARRLLEAARRRFVELDVPYYVAQVDDELAFAEGYK